MLKIPKLKKDNWRIFYFLGLLLDQLLAVYFSDIPKTDSLFALSIEKYHFSLAFILWLLLALIVGYAKQMFINRKLAVRFVEMAFWGLMSNVINQIINNGVVDYIKTNWYRTNLADLLIVGSILGLVGLAFCEDFRRVFIKNKKTPNP